jgi:hypothetical protein
MTNDWVIREYLCGVCHGRLTEIWKDDGYLVVCAADPTHEGHVSQASVIVQETQDRLRASEVLGFYGQMFGVRQPARESGSRALYGDDSPLV